MQHTEVRRLDTPLAFPSANGTQFLRFWEAFDNAVCQAHIENLCLHDLCHSAASYLAMNSASLMEIAEILG
jgi:site-specific recombinase XerD